MGLKKFIALVVAGAFLVVSSPVFSATKKAEAKHQVKHKKTAKKVSKKK